MGLHFAYDGYQDLNTNNPKYLELLKLFYANENFLTTLEKSLESLSLYMAYLVPYVIDENGLVPFFNLCWNNLDDYINYQREIRDRCQMYLLRERARDDLVSDSDEDYSD